MNTIPITRRTQRTLRLKQAIEARRRLADAHPAGRAWINGREVGGPDQRYLHLSRSYD